MNTTEVGHPEERMYSGCVLISAHVDCRGLAIKKGTGNIHQKYCVEIDRDYQRRQELEKSLGPIS